MIAACGVRSVNISKTKEIKANFGEWCEVPKDDLHGQLERNAGRKVLGNPGGCQSKTAGSGPVKPYPKTPKTKSKATCARPSPRDHWCDAREEASRSRTTSASPTGTLARRLMRKEILRSVMQR